MDKRKVIENQNQSLFNHYYDRLLKVIVIIIIIDRIFTEELKIIFTDNLHTALVIFLYDT